MDTGKGIPHEQLHQIFKGVLPADYSTKTKGVSTGFGLVICKRLVEQMGGEITVESQTGVGTKFMFNILTSASDLPVIDYIHNRIIGLEGKQILVVDDNETSISILSKQLDQWKLLPVLAGSGKQALEILSQISVDLVITDLLMPGMNGLQLSEQIRSGYPKIPIILMNTVNDDQYKQQADIFSSIIRKPVKLHSLFDSILTGIRNGDNFTESSALTQIPDNFSDKYPLHILVAEDNPENQKWIKKILLKIGYQCEMAENGKVVMEKVSTENFDLIFMDVQMPEMDGLEATRMIRLCLENQPVIIAMTANAMQGDRDECIQSGMNDYVSKPVKLPVLLNMLEKWALLIKDKRQHAIREKNVL
jgi:CheY-like chemotaxis protein